MNLKAETQLAAFNALALHYQDEAFTLAYYLLGDEAQAAEAAQAAFTRLYKRSDLRQNQFRFEVLHWVLEYCRKAETFFKRALAREEVVRKLLFLNEDERSALVLVDVLGLDYAGASQVLRCSQKQIGKLLAQGRLSLARQSEITQPLARAL